MDICRLLHCPRGRRAHCSGTAAALQRHCGGPHSDCIHMYVYKYTHCVHTANAQLAHTAHTLRARRVYSRTVALRHRDGDTHRGRLPERWALGVRLRWRGDAADEPGLAARAARARVRAGAAREQGGLAGRRVEAWLDHPARHLGAPPRPRAACNPASSLQPCGPSLQPCGPSLQPAAPCLQVALNTLGLAQCYLVITPSR